MRRGITCRLISLMPSDRPLNRVLRRHTDGCAVCQETRLRSTGVARSLHDLGAETLEAPDGLATSVLTRLGAQDGSDPRRPMVRRIAIRYSAAGIVGLATLTALLARLLSRRRR